MNKKNLKDIYTEYINKGKIEYNFSQKSIINELNEIKVFLEKNKSFFSFFEKKPIRNFRFFFRRSDLTFLKLFLLFYFLFDFFL